MGRRPGSKNKPKETTKTIEETVETTETSTPEAPKKRGRPKKESKEPFKLLDEVIIGEDVTIGVDLADGPAMTVYRDLPEKSEDKAKKDSKPNRTKKKITPETFSEGKTSKDTTQPKVASKSKKNTRTVTYPLCDCCHKEIYCQPHRIDTNILSAQVADYYRDSPRWVELCNDCAKELSSVVDTWLKDHGCLTKFEIKAMTQNEDKENSGKYIEDEEFLKLQEAKEDKIEVNASNVNPPTKEEPTIDDDFDW